MVAGMAGETDAAVGVAETEHPATGGRPVPSYLDEGVFPMHQRGEENEQWM